MDGGWILGDRRAWLVIPQGPTKTAGQSQGTRIIYILLLSDKERTSLLLRMPLTTREAQNKLLLPLNNIRMLLRVNEKI